MSIVGFVALFVALIVVLFLVTSPADDAVAASGAGKSQCVSILLFRKLGQCSSCKRAH